MKKLVLFLLLIPFSLIAEQHDYVKLWFKNGAYVEYEANSTWTYFTHKHNYYEWYQVYNNEGSTPNSDYLCFWDYCCMNPVSHDLKKADYTNLRDKILASGNECHYFIKENTATDQWGVSIRYDELQRVITTVKSGGDSPIMIYDENEGKK